VQKREAVLFDSLRNQELAQRAERIMRRFYEAFYLHFETWNREGESFTFQQDQKCAQQDDASSCGLYTMSNILDLMNIVQPCPDPMPLDEIAKVRRKGQKILKSEEKIPFKETEEYFMSEQYLKSVEQTAY
jgi:Ulp1 family protease